MPGARGGPRSGATARRVDRAGRATRREIAQRRRPRLRVRTATLRRPVAFGSACERSPQMIRDAALPNTRTPRCNTSLVSTRKAPRSHHESTKVRNTRRISARSLRASPIARGLRGAPQAYLVVVGECSDLFAVQALPHESAGKG